MLFFKRILDVGRPEASSDRRDAMRYTVHPGFPLTTTLESAGCEAAPKTGSAAGRLINVSSAGARVQLPPDIPVKRGDTGRLKLDVQGYELVIPARIAHVAEGRDARVVGLALDLAEPPTQAAYRQLVDLIALGSTLRQTRPLQPDETGYLMEQYVGEPASCLTIWRQMAGREVAAFEFQLKDSVVRGVAGRQGLDCFTGPERTTARPASGTRGEEILRLYQWVVLNLAPAVPADIRDFLQRTAA